MKLIDVIINACVQLLLDHDDFTAAIDEQPQAYPSPPSSSQSCSRRTMLTLTSAASMTITW
jgi:hypothetical protein